MRESISYTFVLNMVIWFIFVCFAIVLGIFSYYRAFKAGNIIVESIEKYEGYNCLSAKEIGRKLSDISYNVPFDANCNRSDGSPCMVDEDKNYAVVSYNLDYNGGEYVRIVDDFGDREHAETDYEKMNSKFDDGHYGVQTRKYQYGVFTYMYVDFPAVSSLLRLTVYSKTRIMYEFRDIAYWDNHRSYDHRLIPDEYSGLFSFYLFLFNAYIKASTEVLGTSFADAEYSARRVAQYDVNGNLPNFSNMASYVDAAFPRQCGYKINYSKY